MPLDLFIIVAISGVAVVFAGVVTGAAASAALRRRLSKVLNSRTRRA